MSIGGIMQACHRHSSAALMARCPDCQRGMCRVCFDEATFPWKVCSECEPRRRRQVAQTATALAAEDLVCPWCGHETTGLASERPPCPSCGAGMLPAVAARAQL
jgi:hypothetical protein